MTGETIAPTKSEAVELLRTIPEIELDGSGIYRSRSKLSKHITKFVVEQKIQQYSPNFSTYRNRFPPNQTFPRRPIVSYVFDFLIFQHIFFFSSKKLIQPVNQNCFLFKDIAMITLM